MADETWRVELIPGSGRSWETDRTGPQIIYDSREEALAWAVKLATLHANVRLRRTAETTEIVGPSGG